MRKTIRRLIRSVVLLIAFALLVASAALALIQTEWAKEKLSQLIIVGLQQQGIDAQIEGLEGKLPFSWKIDQIRLETSSQEVIRFKEITLRIAFLPLLKKHLMIDYFHSEEALYAFFVEDNSHLNLEKIQTDIGEKITHFSPFFHLFLKNVSVSHFHLHNLTAQKEAIFSLQAQGKWRQDLSSFAFLCKIDEGLMELSARGSKLSDEISVHMKIGIDSIENFPFELPSFLDNSLTQIQLKGPWQTWESLFSNTSCDAEQISCKLLSKLQGGITHLQVLAEIPSHLIDSKLFFSCKSSDLSPFLPALEGLSGETSFRGFYQNGLLKISSTSSDLAIQEQLIGSIETFLSAQIEEGSWKGDLYLNGEKSTIPFFSSFSFLWEKGDSLELSRFILKTEDAVVTSDLRFDLKDKLLEGSLYANVSHLDRFSPFFPRKPPIDGNLGMEISFSRNEASQDLNIDLFCKHIRYGRYLFDDLSARAEILNLHGELEGEIEIAAEKLFSPQGYFERVFLSTYSEGSNWPLAFHLSGGPEHRCELNLLGFWQKKKNSLLMRLNQLHAVAAEQNIVLQTPFEILYKDTSLEFQPSEWVVGEGALSTSAFFSEVESSLDLSIEHFPLEIIGVFNPKFSLKGSFSAQGFLEGSLDNLKGTLNVALEQAQFLQSGLTNPWQTKGSLQLHLDRNMLQIHTHLNAIHDQFLEFSASIPVDYDLYPFKIEISPDRMLNAELTSEGQIQDIFDFIQLGTHRITGFISTHLLLSQTYSHPSLRGEIELQNGSYQNDYTGTFLQKIEALATASDQKIQISHIQGTDEKKGVFFGDGSLQLKPQENYPYAIACELENLHILSSNAISCHLTGPLYITGNLDSALAQGNLKVASATFHIPDHLPYEIPQLPITYVNRPFHLHPQSVPMRKGYPLYFDLELTAENQVYVEGKSLSSEWEGSVHLTGKNLDFAAEGSLSLINGNYVFSGKIFKLDEGIILFSDKKGASAHLNLSGSLSLSDMEITAQLMGPLTSPKLTFQSNPHMPTSSILAKILFNKEISDISHPEAIQLANTLLSLSGGAGPDVLETIRKTLGVDRLTIGSSSSNPDQIALQIGKYLTKGVLVTLSQSPTSSQIIVEVELKKGFIFQAETQEEEEGKFSLKWRKTY